MQARRYYHPPLRLGDIAFYWRMSDLPGRPSPVPDFLPFAFTFDATLGLIVQERNPRVLECLETIYREDWNVGYLQEGHALAEAYGNDVIGFIESVLDPAGAPRVLEIGCGGGYLLSYLRRRGFRVVGIDPSPVAAREAARLEIEVMPGFYPTVRPDARVDAVFHYDVLEHVADPVAFLAAHHHDLAAGGVLLIAVPDATESIALGDISMVIHEHLNFFDRDSLRRTVEAAGFRVLALEKGGYGGVLYCAAVADPTQHAAPPDAAALADTEKFDRFCERVERAVRRFPAFLPRADEAADAPGFYVPLRAIAYLSTLGRTDGIRFFDDDPGIHGRYFDGFPVPVENFTDLQVRPASHIFVTSTAFGDRLKEKVLQGVEPQPEVLTLTELLR